MRQGFQLRDKIAEHTLMLELFDVFATGLAPMAQWLSILREIAESVGKPFRFPRWQISSKAAIFHNASQSALFVRHRYNRTGIGQRDQKLAREKRIP